jgi:hypothetical protein
MSLLSVAIIGGGCSGKSTICDWLVTKQPIPGLVLIEEAATMLLESGYPPRPDDPALWPGWTTHFQRAVLNLQIALEDWTHELHSGRAVIAITDRAIPDSGVFHPEGLAGVSALTGFTPVTMYARYDLAIHLESLATANPEKYGQGNNEHRMEDLEEAVERELITREVWKDHPNRLFIAGDGLDNKYCRTVQALQELIRSTTPDR